MTILFVAEHRDGKLLDPTLEALTLARRLKEKGAPGDLHAVLLGQGVEGLAQELAGYGPTVHYIEGAALEHEVPGAYAKGIEAIVQKVGAKIVLMGHTSVGYDVAPRLAARHGWPLATNVVRADWDNGLKAHRATYGGRVHALMELQGEPALVTVQPGAFPAAKEKADGGTVEKGEVQVAEADTRQKVTGFVKPETTGVDISQAEIVVAVGRGIKEKENVKIAEELANALGGVVAGSRPIVDMEWLPHDRQVGVSGKNVKAKLYIALGISGQVQHITGMKGCEHIIAVNKDANAPIFKVAHVGVVGDLFKFVPALVKALQG